MKTTLKVTMTQPITESDQLMPFLDSYAQQNNLKYVWNSRQTFTVTGANENIATYKSQLDRLNVKYTEQKRTLPTLWPLKTYSPSNGQKVWDEKLIRKYKITAALTAGTLLAIAAILL